MSAIGRMVWSLLDFQTIFALVVGFFKSTLVRKRAAQAQQEQTNTVITIESDMNNTRPVTTETTTDTQEIVNRLKKGTF